MIPLHASIILVEGDERRKSTVKLEDKISSSDFHLKSVSVETMLAHLDLTIKNMLYAHYRYSG